LRSFEPLTVKARTWRICVVNGAPGVCYVVAPTGGVTVVTSITSANQYISVDTNQPRPAPVALARERGSSSGDLGCNAVQR
jgi:hypothetical protein